MRNLANIGTRCGLCIDDIKHLSTLILAVVSYTFALGLIFPTHPAFSQSTTRDLEKSKFSFYSQSSGGRIHTCAFEFEGIDLQGDFFQGSIGLLWSKEKKALVGLLKIKSKSVDLETLQVNIHAVDSGWLKLDNNGDTLSWRIISSGEVFMSISNDSSIIVGIYGKILEGPHVKIGYLKKGNSIDNVYILPTLSSEDLEMALRCLGTLLKTIREDES